MREFLIRYVNSPKKPVQLASLRALGILGDPKAISVVETFATASKESRERFAAENALVELRADRKPVDDFKNLRQEVLDLQKATRDLRKEIEALKKEVETREKTPAKPEPNKKPLKQPKHVDG